jgi:hypothetical protein
MIAENDLPFKTLNVSKRTYCTLLLSGDGNMTRTEAFTQMKHAATRIHQHGLDSQALHPRHYATITPRVHRSV